MIKEAKWIGEYQAFCNVINFEFNKEFSNVILFSVPNYGINLLVKLVLLIFLDSHNLIFVSWEEIVARWTSEEDEKLKHCDI